MEGEGLKFLAGLILLLFLLIVPILLIISFWKIFKKANQPGWASIIPVYNLIVLINIGGKSGWLILTLLIPIVNIVTLIIILNDLSKAFGKGFGFTIGLIFLGFIFFPILAFGDSEHESSTKNNQSNFPNIPSQLSNITNQQNSNSSTQKPPTILSDYVKPGLLGKIYTLFFMDDCVVFVKTGSGSTSIASGQRAFHGGAGATANIMGAFGTLLDFRNSQNRSNNAAAMASLDAASMVAAHKHNFLYKYNEIQLVEIKEPGMIGEMKVTVHANGEKNTFRISNASKSTSQYSFNIFNQFIPNKILLK